jgi:hypothetical protein
VRTASKIILITTVTAAAAAAALVVVKRKRITDEGEIETLTVGQAAVEAKNSILRIVDAVGGSISKSTMARAMQYGIPQLVEQYRGAVPFGVGMAILEHESNFDPYVYNYYYVSGGKKKLGRARACQGCGTYGDGWFEHDPHAVGLGQILDYIRQKQGGYAGVSMPKMTDLLDPAKNIHGSMAGAQTNLKWLVANVGGGIPATALATLIYAGHAEGGGGMQKIASWAKGAGGVTIDVLKDYPGHVYNRLSGLIAVGKRAMLWEAAKPAMLAGSLQGLRTLAALGLITRDGGVPLPRSYRMAA